MRHILRSVDEERYPRGALRIEREVPRLLILQIAGAQRQRRALDRFPAEARLDALPTRPGLSHLTACIATHQTPASAVVRRSPARCQRAVRRSAPATAAQCAA